jgi:PilZ domain
MEKRPESRVPAEIAVRVFGMNAEGKPFFQKAVASNLSSEGATLTRVEHTLKIGEVIGVQHADRKARFEIKWVKPGFLPNTVEAGIQTQPGQTAPWVEITSETRNAALVTPRGSDKRRFTRHRVNFPLTISFSDGSRSHMQCSATDIGGRGCYVESLSPFSIGSELVITFWIDSQKIITKGLVRASDPGVGMGIEFTALEMHHQEKLQQYLESNDKGFAATANQGK